MVKILKMTEEYIWFKVDKVTKDISIVVHIPGVIKGSDSIDLRVYGKLSIDMEHECLCLKDLRFRNNAETFIYKMYIQYMDKLIAVMKEGKDFKSFLKEMRDSTIH